MTVSCQFANNNISSRVSFDHRFLCNAYGFINKHTCIFVIADANVDNADLVQSMRDRMQDALIEYERPRTSSNIRRVGNLLLSLPILMHEKILAKEYWFNVKKGGRVPLHKLLSEMLEYAVST